MSAQGIPPAAQLLQRDRLPLPVERMSPHPDESPPGLGVQLHVRAAATTLWPITTH